MDIYDLLKESDDKSEAVEKMDKPFQEIYALSIASELHRSFKRMDKKALKQFQLKNLFVNVR